MTPAEEVEELDQFLELLRCVLGKKPLPLEPANTGTAISLDGVRSMLPSAWAKELGITKQAVSSRYKSICQRIERGHPAPYARNYRVSYRARREVSS